MPSKPPGGLRWGAAAQFREHDSSGIGSAAPGLGGRRFAEAPFYREPISFFARSARAAGATGRKRSERTCTNGALVHVATFFKFFGPSSCPGSRHHRGGRLVWCRGRCPAMARGLNDLAVRLKFPVRKSRS